MPTGGIGEAQGDPDTGDDCRDPRLAPLSKFNLPGLEAVNAKITRMEDLVRLWLVYRVDDEVDTHEINGLTRRQADLLAKVVLRSGFKSQVIHAYVYADLNIRMGEGIEWRIKVMVELDPSHEDRSPGGLGESVRSLLRA